MTNFLVKKFVKNSENVKDSKVRENYGILSGFVGIFCNIVLFITKLIIGFISQSISITSDAFNNLSDCASCIVTLFGYKLAAKPADKDHPFGHGRIEYLTSSIIAIIILFVCFELFTSSVDKIIHPNKIVFSIPVLLALLISIAVKIWMGFFNKSLGNKTNNQAMIATSKDSLNDALATSATVFALIVSQFTTLPIDGIVGVIVSIIIMFSGIGIIKDTIDQLLGKPADKETVDAITDIIMSHKEALGVHDMIIHNYGPGKMLGSCHVEVDSNSNFLEAHDTIDDIERDIGNELHVIMTIHMDPVMKDDAITNKYKVKVEKIIKNIDADFTLHDFRTVVGPTHTNLVFDVVVPYDCKETNENIKKMIDDELSKEKEKIYTVITFDHPFV